MEEQPHDGSNGSGEEHPPELSTQELGLGLEEKAYREFMFALQQSASMGFEITHCLKTQLSARSKAIDFYGRVMSFFFICACMSLYFGARNLISLRNGVQRMQMDLMSYLLPFVSFMIDAAAKRVYSVSAKSLYQVIKVIFTFYFLCMYVVALNRTSRSYFFWIANVNLLIYPLIICGYWWLLIHGKLS